MNMNPNCERCDLFKLGRQPVPDDGGDYTILCIGEAPGVNENLQGKPFVGRSGKLLRSTLETVGFPMDKVTFTNIIKCHPPDNKMKKSYIKHCYRSVPIKSNTKLVLLFGNTPLNAILGKSGITSWNGVRVERNGITYAPLFHPAYLLRNDSVLDEWLDALDGALDTLTGIKQKRADDDVEYVYPVSSYPEVYEMCEELLNAPIIAFDTEVARLDAFDDSNRILIVSFSDGNKAWAVPIDHPDDLAPASDDIINAICNTLESHPCVIGHNIRFDALQVFAMLDCEFDACGDSMLASFLVNSRRGIHGLKRLAGVHLGMFDYDEELTLYISDHDCKYDGVPLHILLPYAAKDALASYKLHDMLLSSLSDKQRALYHELMIPTSNTLSRMQANGMAVDYDVADRYRRVYSTAVKSILDDINNDPMVLKYVRKREVTLRSLMKSTKTPRKFNFNPGSWVQKGAVLYGSEYYALKPLGTTGTGKPSTKRAIIEPYKGKCPLVDSLISHSMLSKMLNTYILPIANRKFASSDGRVRSNFSQHTVETGRLSSSQPNMQNIPVPEKEPGTILEYQPIKAMFTHTWPGGCLLSIDYSGIELRVFASLAKCQAMIKVHASGRDFHTAVGAMVSGKDYDDISKAERYRYKWVNWTLLYGGSEYTLESLYGISLKEGRKVISDYYDMFPEVLEYKEECSAFAREHGYIETPFGLRRALPFINDRNRSKRAKAEREAVNTPVQGAAGMVTLQALVIIDKLMRQREYRSMLVNTVHDSLLTDVYPGELAELVQLQVDVMEDIVGYACEYMPSIDMSWLTCPLSVDVETGSHYGMLEHYTQK